MGDSAFDFLKFIVGAICYSLNSGDLKHTQAKRELIKLKTSKILPNVRRSMLQSNNQKSLVIEALGIMDEQFEVLEDDVGTTTKKINWVYVVAIVSFPAVIVSLPAFFSLMLIFGVSSFSVIFISVSFLFFGGIIITLCLGEWKRTEEQQAIMNHFEGKHVKWFNYLSFLLDLLSFSTSSFDKILLAPYLPFDSSIMYVSFKTWAAFYSPDALIEGFKLSSSGVNVIMNIILTIVVMLACLNFASRMTR
jgi:hypothetical protein